MNYKTPYNSTIYLFYLLDLNHPSHDLQYLISEVTVTLATMSILKIIGCHSSIDVLSIVVSLNFH